MAGKKAARPGRTLWVFFIGLLVSYGLVAIGGAWKPELGLDLQGGTRITLIAKGEPSADSLTEAAAIIDQRVNGSGVSEAEVTTQGNRFVVVEIPGESRRDLVDTVKRQAQLRFRLVACSSGAPANCATALPPGSDSGSDSGSGITVPQTQPSPSPKKRTGFLMADKKKKSQDKKKQQTQNAPSESPSASPSASPSEEPAPAPVGGELVDKPLEWMNNPDPASIKAYNAFECPADGSPAVVEDISNQPLVTCDDGGIKYLLSAAMIEGTDLKRADAAIPTQQVNWVVSLAFNSAGTAEFTKISRALFGTQDQFAVVLDGQVLSAPTMNGVITNGEAQIEGNFTEATAQSLSTSLKFGALPIAFEKDPPVETVGPSLAGDQLRAGITAGLAGLLLVMIYCLFYYRGLGVVVLVSLIVAAALTYSMVLLLSATAGFTLSLPGIAGLIVAVGITADSFIVFFERIRDEMRDGKSMRVAVEAGWVRARNTCLAADTVSLLAAVVLYIFAAGVVKGFAFALGLSTIIDLVVFFWFTHPMVSWLARFEFFNKGHQLSGLNAGNLGTDRVPVGGIA